MERETQGDIDRSSERERVEASSEKTRKRLYMQGIGRKQTPTQRKSSEGKVGRLNKYTLSNTMANTELVMQLVISRARQEDLD